MAQDPPAFHIEEFKQLKSEIGVLLQRIETLIKFSLFGGVAIYAWILTHAPKSAAGSTSLTVDFLVAAAFLPPALLFLSASLSALTYLHVNIMAQYLRRLEGLLGFASYGWEAHWAKSPRSITYALFAFFVVLQVAGLIVSHYLSGGLQSLALPAKG
ncbi:hypothetical protein [Pseudomonas moorei]|uniref:hypothetical protein n=1 Tax=Pseudomonas moorei TaxID=395599 RepID=UPI001FF57A65|nr:hypothetical protein [Pseudomonas moorei]